jgi:hypothetical protein
MSINNFSSLVGPAGGAGGVGGVSLLNLYCATSFADSLLIINSTQTPALFESPFLGQA